MIEKRSAKRGLQRFAYDAESRLIEVRNENGSVVRMTYDPLGRRIEKIEHGSDGYPLSETRFTWDRLDANGNSMELHHHNPQRNGGRDVNNPRNLREVNREQHAALDEFRHLGGK